MDQLHDRSVALHQGHKRWTLYWRDRNLRFHAYDQLPASPHIDDLLTEIDSDPTCIFWG